MCDLTPGVKGYSQRWPWMGMRSGIKEAEKQEEAHVNTDSVWPRSSILCDPKGVGELWEVRGA